MKYLYPKKSQYFCSVKFKTDFKMKKKCSAEENILLDGRDKISRQDIYLQKIIFKKKFYKHD